MIFTSLCLAVATLGGPYSLGHTSVAWADPARGNQVVTAEVWYPADVAGNNVPIADAPGNGFPVVAFGHGFLMPTAGYQYLWEALVPAGYVMALPTTGGGLSPDHNEFALDLAFLVSRLEQEAATPGSLFEGEISQLGAVGGHSMGGGASVLAAASAPNLEAVFNLAAADTTPSAVVAATGVLQSSLMLAGSNDCVTPIAQHQGPIHAALVSNCKHLVVLNGASHCQFAAPDFFCTFGETCSAAISELQQQALTAALVLSWLDAILLADGSAWDEWQALLGDPAVLSVNGFCNPGPLNYCSADGGDQVGCTNCPCMNNAPAGATGGCLNSAASSARLIASGDTSVSLLPGSTDDLRFAASGVPATAFCILNSGDGVAPGNIANPCFGLNSGVQATAFDGLRCAIVNTRRHGGRSADGNGEVGVTNNPWGGEGGPAVGLAVAGGGFVSGQTRYFQFINRDNPLLGCMRGLNTSQAVEVTFTP